VAKSVHGESDIDDIVQEVFAKIHSGLGHLKESDKLEAWLFQVTRRAIVDHVRGRSGKRRTTEISGEMAERLPEPNVPAEVASCLEPMMSLVPKEDRALLRLADVDGVEQKELAARLGLTVTAAKSRIRRARKRLKEAVLECCRIEMDRRGQPIEYIKKRDNCGPCGCK
jgi:RNA polymerase sigma-70 factor (ECF subfamily)